MNIDRAFKQLKEELLLEGKNWENFYESLPDSIKNKFLERTNKPVKIIKMLKYLDPTSTESNAGKYSRWIMTNHFNYSIEPLIEIYIKTGPIEKTPIYETLEKFEKIKDNLPKKDINKYKDIQDVEEAFERYEAQKSTKKLKGKVDKQIGRWGIKKVNSAEESCELGKGTKWCLTTKNVFDNYNERNNIYFITNGNDKYAFVKGKKEKIEDGKVFDEQDKKLDLDTFLKKLPNEIKDYIK